MGRQEGGSRKGELRGLLTTGRGSDDKTAVDDDTNFDGKTASKANKNYRNLR